jgi:dTDP-4-dehydrorhamnose reductase
MTALVIGASGMIGCHLMQALAETRQEAQGTYWKHQVPGLVPLDICDSNAVQACVQQSAPDAIYLTAALSNVDYCETHPDESFHITVEGTRNIAATGVRLVYFSSDYVFDGEAGPYHEADHVHPLNVYGQHKLLAEQSLPPSALIIRTTVVYGAEGQGKNFVCRLRQVLAGGQELHVPIDQIGSPTYAPNLARAVVVLEQKERYGLYNVVGPRRVSRYEFALEAARVFGLNPNLIKPVSTQEMKQTASRPLNAGLVPDKAQKELSFELMDYYAGLRHLAESAVTTGLSGSVKPSAKEPQKYDS